MFPEIITYPQPAKTKTVYNTRWVPTWGPIGRRTVRHLQRHGWQHIGSLPTGLIRREHCLLKITSIPEEQQR